MKAAQDIIIKPIITEESMTGIMMKKYTFKVAKDAGKIEIKKAVEELFPGTKVKKVNTLNVRGQKRRQGAMWVTPPLGKRLWLPSPRTPRKLSSSTI